MNYQKRFDVIVIGGGHAGTEAALASARLGANTLLITHNIDTIGQMSCNPAIGGIGKSHLVREIDALGGVMARATDCAGIQFRVLNARKGPAVRATRAQTDRQLYKVAIRSSVENQANLSLFQQTVDDLIIKGDAVTGVVTGMGLKFFASQVVMTVGTFLGGRIHIGLNDVEGGRAGEKASNRLAQRLRELPFRVERLKTGTPPRIDARTVDFSVMQQQPGDTPRPVMSFYSTRDQHPEQRMCFITHTNEMTHDIIRGALDRSPMYTGVIDGVGPRYCPSVEDKVHRFADKSSHQVFVEPEGLTTHELYPNGISTSLPFDAQYDLVRSISGFESASITRPGYAIEYDYFDPRDLQHTLETRIVRGLYFAGQINGTTGYEEAGAQGLLAGMNAALRSAERQQWYPTRDEAYLGVMVDDLITLGTTEPYRMFTSRAEFRLLLREDNADQRLTEIGRHLGLVSDEQWISYENKMSAIEKEKSRLASTWVQVGTDVAHAFTPHLKTPLVRESNLLDILKRPEITYETLIKCAGHPATDEGDNSWDKTLAIGDLLAIAEKYAGYVERQKLEVQKLKRNEATTIPDAFDYSEINGLSNEVKQKLSHAQPKTIGHASRIPGVTPAAISLILVQLKKLVQSKESSMNATFGS